MAVPREVPTLRELEARLRELRAEEAARVRSRMAPVLGPGVQLPGPPPRFESWDQFIRATPEREVRAWCSAKAKKANAERMMSATPERSLGVEDVVAVLYAARGRCFHCDSLAVERRPSRPDGAPAPWENVGRRIGSLGHLVARFNGGGNDKDNVAWSCLWCNTWVRERLFGAQDHGAVHS